MDQCKSSQKAPRFVCYPPELLFRRGKFSSDCLLLPLRGLKFATDVGGDIIDAHVLLQAHQATSDHLLGYRWTDRNIHRRIEPTYGRKQSEHANLSCRNHARDFFIDD